MSKALPYRPVVGRESRQSLRVHGGVHAVFAMKCKRGTCLKVTKSNLVPIFESLGALQWCTAARQYQPTRHKERYQTPMGRAVRDTIAASWAA